MPYSTDEQTHLFTRVLDNYLKLCVLDDYPKYGHCSKTCLSITINKGHFSACEFPEGLAHLFEHMLFSSSKHFPNQRKLDEHLFEYHGQFNAWTQDQCMNIQMLCEHDGFLSALDILIDRLSNPLFSLRDIETEISVLDAEFSSKKNDPLRGLISVQKATCNQDHPYSRFSSGNAETLSKKNTKAIQSDLISFHQLSIQGANMSVCVGVSQAGYCKQFTDYIIQKFSQLPNSTMPFNENSELPPIYNNNQLKKLILVEQSNMTPQIVVSYIVNSCSDDNQHTRNSAYLMLSHLLESKHKNGLFYQLKKHNLVEDISCDFKHLDMANDEFFINLKLTKFHNDALEKTLELVERYIDFISQKGIENWRFREKSEQYKLATKLERPPGLLEQCIKISQWMLQDMSLSDIEHQIYSSNELVFDEKVVDTILKQLQPFKQRVYLISDAALSSDTGVNLTPHYCVKYAVSQLPEQTNKIKSLAFEKPRQNPYMPNEFNLYKQTMKHSQPFVRTSETLNFKFYQHTQFKLPTGECYLSISDPTMGNTSQQIRIKRIWVDCLQRACDTVFFDAHLASLHHRLYAHKTGVTIHIQGVCEKQILYSIELLNLVLNFKADSNEIQSAIVRTQQQSAQAQHVRPLNQMFNKLIEIYQPDKFSNQVVDKATIELTKNHVLTQQQDYFKTCFIECLMIGNWQIDQALKFVSLIEKRLKDKEPFARKIVNPTPFKNGIHVHTKLNTSSNVVVWHYTPVFDDDNQLQEIRLNHHSLNKIGARAIILERLLSFTVFNVLRQKYKMGYSLGVGYKPIGKLPGIAIYVESPTHSEKEIFKGLREVLTESFALLQDKKFSFEKLQKELVRQVTPEDKSLRQVANRAWLHFDDENPLLGYLDLINAIKSTTVDDIATSLETLVNNNNYQVITTLSANDKADIKPFH